MGTSDDEITSAIRDFKNAILKARPLVPVILALLLSLTISLVYGATGADIHYLITFAEEYARGENGLFNQATQTFYAPLFPFLLVPSVWFNIQWSFAAFLQALFYPAAVASFMFLCWKALDKQYALLGGFLIMGSFAFFDRTIQPTPQGLDFILLPLAILFTLQKFKKTSKKRASKLSRRYIAISAVMILNHGLVGIAALGGTLLVQLRRRWKTVVVIAIIASPIIILSAIFYIPALAVGASGPVTSTEVQFWRSPFFFTLGYQGLPAAGFFVGLYLLIRAWRKGQPLSMLTKIGLLTVASTAVMIPVWPDRWLQYATIPLSLLVLEQMRASRPVIQKLLRYGIYIIFLFMGLLLWYLYFLGGFSA